MIILPARPRNPDRLACGLPVSLAVDDTLRQAARVHDLTRQYKEGMANREKLSAPFTNVCARIAHQRYPSRTSMRCRTTIMPSDGNTNCDSP